jgi:aspartyl aminopeptidase
MERGERMPKEGKDKDKPDLKTENQKLEERLAYTSKNIWLEIDEKTVKSIFDFAESYKAFLRRAKSERLTVRWILENAEQRGYRDLLGIDKVEKGGAYYILNRQKNIALAKIGRRPIEEGVNFIVAHADAPRLDLKQVPLVEDTEIAILKTHYYGGIKKYQWLNIPLAITGVVVTRGNKTVEITLGLDETDPIFVIPDLLPHLSRKVQGEKKANEFIEGETLNLLFGNIPVKDDKVKEKVKLAVLKKLNDTYGITEEDLISAELEAVPAFQPRDAGIDRSLVAGYAHDDRVSTYSAVASVLESGEIDKTAVVFIVDKEEIGSEGPTGAKSLFIYNAIGRIIELAKGKCPDGLLRLTMERSVCISADVNVGMDPMYKSVHDEKNAAKISHGIVITKYTGSGGKYSANDADAELVGKFRNLFNENGIFWQYGGLGKVDEGGGGTIAKHFAFYNASVIDCGIPVIGMHSPYELISKADLYYGYLAYKVFLEKG